MPMSFSAESCQKSVLKQKPFVDYVPRTVLIFPWSVAYHNKQCGEMRRFIFWDAEYGWVIASASAANWKFLDPRAGLVGFCVVTRTAAKKDAYERVSAGRGMTRDERAWYESQKEALTAVLDHVAAATTQEERLTAIANAVMPEAPAWMTAREHLAKSLTRDTHTVAYSRHSPQWVRTSPDNQQSEIFTAWELSDYKRKTGEAEFILHREDHTSCRVRLYPLKAADLTAELKQFEGRRFKLSRKVTIARQTGKVLRVFELNAVAAE